MKACARALLVWLCLVAGTLIPVLLALAARKS